MKTDDQRLFLVTVRVNLATMAAFAQKLQRGELDRSAIRATYCLADDPAVGLGIWEVASEEELRIRLAPWRPYYESVETRELITPSQAFVLLSQRAE